MKARFLILFPLSICSLSAFSKTIESVDEALRKVPLRVEFCQHIEEVLPAGATVIEDDCTLVGAVRVVQKISDQLEGVDILTALSLRYSDESQGLECGGRAVKSLDNYVVDNYGNIKKHAGEWRIVDVKCNSTQSLTNEAILAAYERDDNVKVLSADELSALPVRVREAIIRPEMVSESDSAYYSVIDDSHKYYKILDPEDSTVVIGYLTTAKLSYTEEDGGEYSASAHFTVNGRRVDAPEEQ